MKNIVTGLFAILLICGFSSCKFMAEKMYPEIVGHTFVQVKEFTGDDAVTIIKETVILNLNTNGKVSVSTKYENSIHPDAEGSGTYKITGKYIQMNIDYDRDANGYADHYLENMGKKFYYEYTPEGNKLKISSRPMLDGPYMLNLVRAD